jgi:hypothetical protein
MSLMGAAGAMGGAVAGGMVSAINAGSAIKSSIQSAAASGATGIGGMAAQTTKNLAGSVGHTIGDLVSGTGNPRPSFGQRAASHARARLVDQKQEKTADTANTTSTNGEKSK